jgi:hypothetical protein
LEEEHLVQQPAAESELTRGLGRAADGRRDSSRINSYRRRSRDYAIESLLVGVLKGVIFF